MFLSEGTAIYELPKAFPFGRPNPRGLFPQSLPLWGRWPSEARSDEVVNRIRLLLHLHRLFYSLCPMLGRIFCGGFPAQETSALAHIAVELPRLKSAGGTRRFSEGNSDRGTPPSLPPWGRWQPEGLTDEVVYRNPPPLLIPFVLFAVSHVGTAFCGGFPPDCRHAALTPALLHSASAGFGRRSQMRAPSVRLCRTLQRLAIARLPGDPENVLFSCSGQKLGTRPQRGRGPKFLFGKHAARKGRPSVLLYIACENTTSSVSPTDCHHSMGLPARPH